MKAINELSRNKMDMNLNLITLSINGAILIQKNKKYFKKFNPINKTCTISVLLRKVIFYSKITITWLPTVKFTI